MTNLAPMTNFPAGSGCKVRLNTPGPHPQCVCVWGGGGGTLIFSCIRRLGSFGGGGSKF